MTTIAHFEKTEPDHASPSAPLWEARNDDSYTLEGTQRRDQTPPPAFFREAISGDSCKLENTHRKHRTLLTALIWEARPDDSYTLENHQGEGSNTSYSIPPGGQT